jgi:hypothetical protein
MNAIYGALIFVPVSNSLLARFAFLVILTAELLASNSVDL